jgi:hypothetical protein
MLAHNKGRDGISTYTRLASMRSEYLPTVTVLFEWGRTAINVIWLGFGEAFNRSLRRRLV